MAGLERDHVCVDLRHLDPAYARPRRSQPCQQGSGPAPKHRPPAAPRTIFEVFYRSGAHRAIELRSSGVPAPGDFRPCAPGGTAGAGSSERPETRRKPRMCGPFAPVNGGGGIRTLDGPIRPITVSRPTHDGLHDRRTRAVTPQTPRPGRPHRPRNSTLGGVVLRPRRGHAARLALEPIRRRSFP
jgi:hypothetical protein